MPSRISPIRPLRPRGYYGAQQMQSPYAGAFKAGGAMGTELAKGIGAAMKARQQQALDVQANQLMTPPNQPVDTQGTLGDEPLVNEIVNPPFTGGVAGMKVQQDFIRSSLENQRLAQEVRNQGIASSMAARRGGGGGAAGGGGGNANRWQQYLGGQGGQGGQGASKAGKPATYQANSSTETDPSYYDFNHQRIDVDAQYGKGTHDRLLAGSGQLGPPDPKTGARSDAVVDKDGNVTKPATITVDGQGNVTLAPKGNYPGAYMQAADVQKNMARNDATAVQRGGSPRFTDQYLKTQHPEAGLPNGDPTNPYLLAPDQTTLQLNAIPAGKWFVDPNDGKVKQKAPPGQPPAKATSQVDTGDQSQQVAAAQPQTQMPSQPSNAGQPQTPQPGLTGSDQGQGQDFTGGQPQMAQGPQPQMAQGPQPPVDQSALAASNTPPGVFNIGQPAGGGLPQGVDLGDEIKRSQIAASLQGVA